MKRNYLNQLLFTLAGLLLWQSPATAQSQVDAAQASVTPWSGYWWPHKEGAIQGPLSKYDRLTGRTALLWEQQQYPAHEGVLDWHGYCHAWAASSVLETEPQSDRYVRPRGSSVDPVHLTVGDQKGLLAAAHAEDVANSYGDRFGDGEGDESDDLAPETLWRLLRMYVKNQGIPLIVDIDATEEVWNYPVYRYEIRHWPHDGEFTRIARMTLWMADNGVHPDYIGTQVRKQTYLFTFEMRDGLIVAGTGKWIDRSATDHIDFAWYPFVAQPENPEIQYGTVLSILGRDIPEAALTSTSGSTTSSADEVAAADTSDDVPTDEPDSVDSENATAAMAEQPAETLVTDHETTVRPETVRPETVQPETDQPGAVANDSTGSSPATVARPADTAVSTPSSDILEDIVVVSPMELVGLILNQTSAFALDVTVDRFDGGHYLPGETVGIRGGSEQAGYLYLLLIDSEGNPRLLTPQRGQAHRVAAGRPFSFLGTDGYVLPADARGGVYRIKAVVTARPLIISGMVSDGIQRQSLRVPQAQQRQVRKVLRNIDRRRLSHLQLGTQSSRSLIGEFAQDEVAFYVDGDSGTDARRTEP